MNPIDASAPDPTAYHPLFPPPDGADEDAYPPNATTIASINVIRHTAKGQDWCPRTFQPYELPDLATLSHMFGGGFFELVAKDGKGRVLRRVRYPIAGEPKPFEGETPTARHDAPAAALAAPTIAGLDPMFALLLQQQREQMAMMMQSQNQMTQVLVAALGGRPQSDPAAMAAAMSSAMGQAFTAAATINAAHAPPRDPPNNLGALREALTIAKEVQAAGSAADDIPATVAAVAQAVATVAPMLKAAPTPAAG